LKPEERCASTSNRNFEGRQGFKGRTHLVSPAMAAAAAIAGYFVDVREWRELPCFNLGGVRKPPLKEEGAGCPLAGFARGASARANKPEFVDFVLHANPQHWRPT